MIKQAIEAHVFYKHDPRETQALRAAVIPMAAHIKAVSQGHDRSKMREILEGEYFRVKDADRMRCVLLRATRHARAHLVEYFPIVRSEIMTNAEELEQAVEDYWEEFKQMVNETVPGL
jgi:hypothetical protein